MLHLFAPRKVRNNSPLRASPGGRLNQNTASKFRASATSHGPALAGRHDWTFLIMHEKAAGFGHRCGMKFLPLERSVFRPHQTYQLEFTVFPSDFHAVILASSRGLLDPVLWLTCFISLSGARAMPRPSKLVFAFPALTHVVPGCAPSVVRPWDCLSGSGPKV